ncbi:unnamed protein product [Pieris brassicae]|uniref:HTH psq-type domain-containing protein n=1 Tax=Pieris brassicae TaxID=7116 RepID=A0A9P0TQK3_PIEBR|nr:unnamed protein product [Pieris brassicae]
MPKEKKKYYDPNTLNLALNEIRETGKIREIARKYNIPKSTLHFKLKNPTHRTSFGPPPVLTEGEERTLEVWIKEVMKKGFPLKTDDLKQSVFKFLTENPRPNKFINNYPGDGWQQPETNSSNVITLAKFKELVGHSIMSKLYAYDNNPVDDENVNILYRLYSVFDVYCSQSSSVQNNLTSRVENIPLENIDSPLTIQPIEEIEMNNESRCDKDLEEHRSKYLVHLEITKQMSYSVYFLRMMI